MRGGEHRRHGDPGSGAAVEARGRKDSGLYHRAMRFPALPASLVLAFAAGTLLTGCQSTPGETPAEAAAEAAHPGAPETISEPVTEKGAERTPTGEPDGREAFAAAPAHGADNGLPSTLEQGAAAGAPPAAEGSDGAQAAADGTRGARPATTSVTPAAATVPPPQRDGHAHQYELRTYGTDIEVYMDGTRVPQERIVVRGARVGVLDEKGVVVERLDLPRNWMDSESPPDASVLKGNPYNFRDIAGVQLTPPKAMLGGRLSDVPAPLLAHLEKDGVVRNRACIVTGVIPDLPLAKAGIKDHDVIVAVNHIPDADPESIRAIVRALSPGETIAFRVLRNGQSFDAEVAVAAWDPKYMVRPVGDRGDPMARPVKVVQTPSPDGSLEAARAEASAARAEAEKAHVKMMSLQQELEAMHSAGAAATAAAANGAAPTPESVAALHAEVVRLQKRITQLEKEARANDQVRKAIRPAAAPQPAVAP